MPYDHNRQFRASIIRGKALNDLDELLLLYAEIISEITPCERDYFEIEFNSRLKMKLPEASKKTLDNHRTEISGKLFGLFYEKNNLILTSDRTNNLIETKDQPAFFKDICSKFQFPTGLNKIFNIKIMQDKNISVRQFAYFLKVLEILSEKNIFIDRKQAGYYVFNSYDVLTRTASPLEVVSQIEKDIKISVYRQIQTPQKARSYDMQHINEQINLLILANLIFLKNNKLYLNKNEINYIKALTKNAEKPPLFNFSNYNLNNIGERKNALRAWDLFFSKSGDVDKNSLSTKITALNHKNNISLINDTSAQDLGNEGEEYVYQYEKQKVSKISNELKNKVLNLSKIKGIGYDIKSVCISSANSTVPIYIEVKSTKRVTTPKFFFDSVNLTRNEWIAAETYGENFYIYRVFFTTDGTKIFRIKNPFKKYLDKKLKIIPLTYRLDFEDKSGDFVNE